MKRFTNYRALGAGEVISFANSEGRHNVSGVCSGPVRVFGQSPQHDEPVFFAYLAPGDFKFDIGMKGEFVLIFDFDDGTFVSLYQPAGATLTVYSPEDTWTTVSHRPAINPQLAAIQRQLRLLSNEVAANKAREYARQTQRARARAASLAQPAPATGATAPEAAAPAAPAASSDPAEPGPVSDAS